MSSYQPPVDTTAIFNSQSFSASNYSGESDPNKLDFPNAQGVPTMTAVNVSDGTNTSLVTPTGITNSGAYSFNTNSPNPIRTTNANNNVLISSRATFPSIGPSNTCLGNNTLNTTANSLSEQNTCIGNNAGNKIGNSGTTVNDGSYNTFVGSNSGFANTTGYSNVGLGLNAGNALTTGNSNTSIGAGSGAALAIGNGNVFVGHGSAPSILGSLNTCIGQTAGGGISSGNTNTFIGAATSSSVNVGNSSVIGYNAVATASNQVVLGTSTETVIVPSTTGINLLNRNIIGSSQSITATTALVGASISTTTMTVSPSNSAIVIGTAVFGVGVTVGTVVTAIVTASTSFTVNNSQTSTPTSYLPIGASQIVQIATINNGTPGVSGNIMTITALLQGYTLPIGAAIFGAGVNPNTRITAVTSPTVYTLSVNSVLSSTINGTFTAEGSTTLTYPLSQMYHITPSLFSAYSITLPYIISANVGSKTTLRMTNASTLNVSLTSVSPIFAGTSATPANSHTIYNGGGSSILFSATSTTAGISGTTLTLTTTPPTLQVGTLITGGTTLANTYVTAVLTASTYTVSRSQTSTPTTYQLGGVLTSHTFMALPTTQGAGGFGWFQLGTV
jgi:hypothetical protein